MSAATLGALAVMGISVDLHGNAEQRVRCPRCDHGPRDDALGVNVETGVYHCYRCQWKGKAVNDGESTSQTLQPTATARGDQQHTTLSGWGRSLWRQCLSVDGVARAYLEARRCHLPPEDGDLRWLPQLKHPSGYTGPALVALVTHALTREPLTLHRTWIQADGNKAPVDKPRLLLAGHTKRGGVIRLWPDDCVDYGVAAGEGIESCLSAAHVVRPVWSCIDAGGMETMPVLPAVEALTIFADHDDAGLKAARALARRWKAAGRDVRILKPRVAGQDINDVARQRIA